MFSFYFIFFQQPWRTKQGSGCFLIEASKKEELPLLCRPRPEWGRCSQSHVSGEQWDSYTCSSRFAWARSWFYISFLTSLTYGLWSFLFKKPVTKNTSLRYLWLQVLIAFWGLQGNLRSVPWGSPSRHDSFISFILKEKGSHLFYSCRQSMNGHIPPQEAQGMRGS